MEAHVPLTKSSLEHCCKYQKGKANHTVSEWDELKWLRVIHQVVQHCAPVLESSEGRDGSGNNGDLLWL